MQYIVKPIYNENLKCLRGVRAKEICKTEFGTVALLESDNNIEDADRNVYMLDEDGRTIWVIDKSPHGGDMDKPYTGLYVRDVDGKQTVTATNWNGVEYEIDLLTGHVRALSFNRF